jgi:hypothetical protein
MKLGKLGNAVDQIGHFASEILFQLLPGIVGVFDGIMKYSGGNGRRVHFHVGQDMGDTNGMSKKGLAGIANLTLVGLF